MDVLKGESIQVGLPDVDLSRLGSYFGEERVDKLLTLWSQLIAKITVQPVQEIIFAAESPEKHGGCLSPTTLSKVNMREIVEDKWNELGQKEGENIMSFYGKGHRNEARIIRR